jgi:hypothetical protein
MIVFKADHRILTKHMPYSFLSSNKTSAVTVLPMVSTTGLAEHDYLVSDWGNETNEIVQIKSVDSEIQVTLESSTKFAHAEGTRFTKIPYNQVRWYRTTTPVFSAGHPLGTTNINAQSYYTSYTDTVYGTGYVWYIFLNQETGDNSSPSNYITYTLPAENTAEKIMKAFLYDLSDSDAQKLDFSQIFRWLSEGYNILYRELNLVNTQYAVKAMYTVPIVSGTQEYAFPSDFSTMISLTDGDGEEVDFIKLEDVEYNKANGSVSNPKYSLRNNYLVVTPTPTTATSWYLYYLKTSPNITKFSDTVEMPNNDYYLLNEYLHYKASPRLMRDGTTYLNSFNVKIKEMKTTDYKQDCNKETWGIKDTSNI